jgi:hypothetical protein
VREVRQILFKEVKKGLRILARSVVAIEHDRSHFSQTVKILQQLGKVVVRDLHGGLV